MPDDVTQTPVDPFALARRISTDPAIPPEERLALLVEIGDGVGVDTGRVAAIGHLSVEKKIELIGMSIARWGELAQSNREIMGQVAGINAQADSQLRTNLGRINDRVRELDQQYQGSLHSPDKKQ